MNLIARPRDKNGLSAVPMRVNRLFENLLEAPWGGMLRGDTYVPAMDVLETSEAIELYLDLPGVDPDSVELSIQKDRLEISGRRTALDTPEDARWYRFERDAGGFHRTLSLPVAVDAEQATATSHHGLLHVVLPKVAEARPKRIEIKGS